MTNGSSYEYKGYDPLGRVAGPLGLLAVLQRLRFAASMLISSIAPSVKTVEELGSELFSVVAWS